MGNGNPANPMPRVKLLLGLTINTSFCGKNQVSTIFFLCAFLILTFGLVVNFDKTGTKL